MKDWLKLFFAKNDAILLTLNGKTFKKSDCQWLGGGAEKDVYQIKGTNQCFFIPHRIDREVVWGEKIHTSEDFWNSKIEGEKFLLDQISALGLKTQRFEILPLKIEDPGKSTYTLNVLVTKDFNSLCEEESLVIYNRKGEQTIIGNPPNFFAMKEQFKEKYFAQKVIKKIITEYAIAFTFTLPTSILYVLDDSEHFCFELPKDATEPPVARYMFWDVLSDFHGVGIPIVPTLNELKFGSREEHPNSSSQAPLQGLINLAYQVASPIVKMSSPQIADFNVDSLAVDLLTALNDDDILNEALVHARKLASKFINNLLKENEHNKIDNEDFILLMQSVISIGEFDLFLRAFQVFEHPADMPQEDVDKIIAIAKKYKAQPIIDYLNIHLVEEKANREAERNIRLAQEKAKNEAEKVEAEEKHRKESEQLKNDFLQCYDEKLTDDKSAWCGIYSFFAKSYVNKNMSLKQLVEHAQGRSMHGNGKRSKEIMKTMGWLDENNEITDKISRYIM
ncbi:hypothetical protein OQJ05_02915 [Fluoribacter gormanii]|uniref:hypothetical protein n=1 Tax=Fluoribacter gormanii TaxID=464 RepID=UPI0022441A28|nr:hypothetical protein [Fluoribacter gormanii]MCW8443001.1 hypothetical protein [Fluoribacter gormanii]